VLAYLAAPAGGHPHAQRVAHDLGVPLAGLAPEGARVTTTAVRGAVAPAVAGRACSGGSPVRLPLPARSCL
jgi:hypothetical protein